MKNIALTLKELGLTTNETAVYLALTVLGEAKGSQIAKKAGLSRTTALSILDRLAKQGFITSHKYHGTIYYWVESPTVIKESFRQKARIADDLASVLTSLYRSGHSLPTGKVYDTKASIKSCIEKLLLGTKTAQIYTIDSPGSGNYQKVLADDYNSLLLNLKKQKNIVTKTLIPFGSGHSIEPNKLKAQTIQIKELPEGLHFEASIWLVDDQLVLFSGNPPFMTVLKHPALVGSFKQLFDYFWAI
jgi:predicted transcriptional regulator